MYQCEHCGGQFQRFRTPGQCPRCHIWAQVRCRDCGYTDGAGVFIRNGDRCPGCGATVRLAGSGPETETRNSLAGIAVAVVLVLTVALAFYAWNDQSAGPQTPRPRQRIERQRPTDEAHRQPVEQVQQIFERPELRRER